MLPADDELGQPGQGIAGGRGRKHVQLLHGKLAENDRLFAGVGKRIGVVPVGSQASRGGGCRNY